MSRIVFCWEQGQNYGHILGFLPCALALRARGHEVVFVLRDLSRAEQILGKHGFKALQAPLWLPRAEGLPPPVSYADILASAGYLDPSGLTGLVKAWRELFQLLDPELMIMDCAPTALLAARGQGIPRAMIGTGFFSPPKLSPLPAIRFWQHLPGPRLMQGEAVILHGINRALENISQPPLAALRELFQVEEDFLCTLPELDHYPGREGARYWGPRFALEEGAEPAWTPGEGPTVFAYVYPGYRLFEPLMQALRALPARVLVYAPGIAGRYVRQLASERLAFAQAPVRMASVRSRADVAVCHGGHGTVAAMLLAGRPVLMLPMQVEQEILARRVVELGAGLSVGLEMQEVNLKRLLKRLLSETGFRESASRLAQAHEGFSQEKQIAAIADRCEELLRGTLQSANVLAKNDLHLKDQMSR